MKDIGERLWREASDLEDRGLLDAAIGKYKEAVRYGSVAAMNNLATIYDDKMAPPRRDKAVSLYERAARLGDPTSAWNLAMHYRNLGNLVAGLHWMKTAAILGNEDARIVLAAWAYGVVIVSCDNEPNCP